MTATKKRKIFKCVFVVTLLLAIAAGIVYILVARNEKKFIGSIGGYVNSYSKVSESEYKANVVFYKGGEVALNKEYTYATEPTIGKTEVLYYLTTDEDNYLDEEPNLWVSFAWIGIVAGGLLLVAIISGLIMKSIRPRRNAKVAKKIKVDNKSMLK